MKQFLILKSVILAGLFLFSGCSSTSKTEAPEAQAASKADFVSSQFQNLDGCFLLYDVQNEKWDEVYNQKRCEERHSPCSTFKVPLAVMGFESGVLKDENTAFKWDGKQRMIPAWNKDATAASWMKDSVVWYSQRLTMKMGRKKSQAYLTAFEYGNKDFSGGLEDAWLTKAPFMDKGPRPSIFISGYEQIDFLKKLWTEKLPVSLRSMQLAQKLTYLETSPKGFQIHGKTGSGFMGPEHKHRLGWFVAQIEGNGKEYVAVVNINDPLGGPPVPGFASAQAKEIMKNVLTEKGLF